MLSARIHTTDGARTYGVTISTIYISPNDSELLWLTPNKHDNKRHTSNRWNPYISILVLKYMHIKVFLGICVEREHLLVPFSSKLFPHTEWLV